MTPEQVQSITSLDFKQLQAKLQNGQLQAVDVLRAYQSKALELNKTINCITDAIVEAEDQAAACDKMTDKQSPLHGMPLSVKDNIGVKGYETTGGMQINIGRVSELDSVIVQVFKRYGAIPFVKTNVPQSMYSYTCSNKIFGETSNPHNTKRTPGGSSGGEGAILGGGGSIIGLGTDVGGSVRVPAVFCGVCALKPTVGRFSSKGIYTLNPGQTQIMGVAGPMAHDVHSLVEMTRIMTAPDMWELDPTIPRMPFQEQLFASEHKLRIGYYTWDGVLPPVPAVARAVHVARKALESLGHTLVEFSPPGYGDAYASLYIATMAGGDRGQTLREKVKDDYLDRGLQMLWIANLPQWLIGLLAAMIQSKDAVQAKVLRGLISAGTTYSWFRHVEKLRDYRNNFVKQWQSLKLDAVICPVFASPAPYSEDVGQLTAAASGAALYNLVNFPAGALPVTRVNEQDIEDTNNPVLYPAQTAFEKLLKRSCSSADSKGLPVGVQCVTLPYTEELCLRLMTELEGAVGFASK
nr:hypothetical protein BaRGS_034141 [Batillaria attramentaria]